MSLALHYWMGDAHHCSGTPVSEMTYTVSSGTLNPTIPYHLLVTWQFVSHRVRLCMNVLHAQMSNSISLGGSKAGMNHSNVSFIDILSWHHCTSNVILLLHWHVGTLLARWSLLQQSNENILTKKPTTTVAVENTISLLQRISDDFTVSLTIGGIAVLFAPFIKPLSSNMIMNIQFLSHCNNYSTIIRTWQWLLHVQR